MLPAIFLDSEGFRSRPIALWIAHEPLPKVHASAAALRRYLWFSTDTFEVAVREGVGGGAGSIVQLKRVQWRQGHAGTQLLSLLHLPAK